MEFSSLEIEKLLKVDRSSNSEAGKLLVSCINDKICSRYVDFDTDEKIANACTCADTNGHKF